MPLPTCECIEGKPIQQQLGAIYCALLEILGQGEEITLSQISDLDASWVSPLQAPILSFTITASQISDSTANGRLLVTTLGAGDGFVTIDGGAASLKGFGLTSVVDTGATPNLDIDSGLVNNAT